jgi:hypothetical protein
MKKCLNGYWDFFPVYGELDATKIPADGWIKDTYQVPSFWTKETCALRKKGEGQFQTRRWREQKDVLNGDDYEFLYDAFGYPNEWSKTRQGWLKRTVEITKRSGKRYFLDIEAVTQFSYLFINGTPVAENREPSLPFVTDITDHIKSGLNEIVVLLKNYDHDERGRVKACAPGQVHAHAGIWQNVYIDERSDVYVDDVIIRTSTRTKTITAIYSIKNASPHDRSVDITSDVVEWKKKGNPGKAEAVIALPAKRTTIAAGETATWESTVSWEDAQWWSPESPRLYQLRTTIIESNKTLEMAFERFGFREVWIDGPNFMLNGFPLRMFSDWGHKYSHYHLTEGWIRQWFGMIRDGNMNHSRLHVHPHIKLVLDLADEEGILITDECGLYGSGMEHATDWPPLWDMARDHVRRFYKRDKNHPSVILWSVENEMRWNCGDTPLTSKELPELRKLLNELDPTRAAYHEGDSSLWDESRQQIISRHYGRNSFGAGWWDRKQPLHVGEMSVYHYASPNCTLDVGGDSVFARYEDLDAASATDTALCIEAGRALGICCFGPWNQSCLENLRLEKEKAELTYDDLTVPGVKPRIVNAHAAEFAFWKKGKGYTPFVSFDIQKRAFRLFAVIDPSQKNGYCSGATITREISVINDTAAPVEGTLFVSIAGKGVIVHESNYPMSLTRGQIEARTITIALPDDTPAGNYQYRAEFRAGEKKLDGWIRTFAIAPRQTASRALSPFVKKQVGVFGSGTLKPALANLGIEFCYLPSLEKEYLRDVKIVLIEKNALTAENAATSGLKEFVARGGRLIVLEQTYGLFPALLLEKKKVVKVFVRAANHPVLKGVKPEELAFWGEDPYTATKSDTNVAEMMYQKNDAKNTLFIAESGEGGFGIGTLDYSPLFEHREGKGLVLVCQLRISDKMADTPAAEKLFLNMLKRADSYRPSNDDAPIVADGADLGSIGAHADAARKGRTVVVNNAIPEALAQWSDALGVKLVHRKMEETYQAVRVSDDPLLYGVNNEDTCGIETWAYAPAAKENLTVGSDFIAFADGIEPLLETPDASCLKELFVKGGLSESLRAFTVSTTLHVNKAEKAIVVGRIRAGSGTVIFNQFNPPFDKRIRFKRLANRLIANLGVVADGESIFDGARSAKASVMSNGYPREVFVYNGPCGDSEKTALVSCTLAGEKKTFKEVAAKSFLMFSNDGVWKANGYDLAHDLWIYYCISSPSERKSGISNVGVINPEAFTFMDIEGEGTVELIVNGQAFNQVAAVDGKATVADISLEQGENRILAHWKPVCDKSTLHMKWRNIMREPEVGFWMHY